MEALADRGYRVEVAGRADGRPLYAVRSGGAGAVRVLLCAGVHGDEEAGVEALLRFLERTRGDGDGAFHFTALPLINPWGYEAGTRGNACGADINRAFEGSEVAEAEVVKGYLTGRRFDVHVDFHEDYEGQGFYLYEGRQAGDWLGPEVLAAVAAVSPIEPDHDDEIVLYPGGFGLDGAWGTKGVCTWVLAHCAPHGFTFEAALPQPLKQRVAAHLAGLQVVLDHYAAG